MSEVQADIVIAGGEFCNPSCGPYLANAGVGGTAGCVIAGRLAEARPDLSIVVIEDGKDSKDDKDIEREGSFWPTFPPLSMANLSRAILRGSDGELMAVRSPVRRHGCTSRKQEM